MQKILLCIVLFCTALVHAQRPAQHGDQDFQSLASELLGQVPSIPVAQPTAPDEELVLATAIYGEFDSLTLYLPSNNRGRVANYFQAYAYGYLDGVAGRTFTGYRGYSVAQQYVFLRDTSFYSRDSTQFEFNRATYDSTGFRTEARRSLTVFSARGQNARFGRVTTRDYDATGQLTQTSTSGRLDSTYVSVDTMVSVYLTSGSFGPDSLEPSRIFKVVLNELGRSTYLESLSFATSADGQREVAHRRAVSTAYDDGGNVTISVARYGTGQIYGGSLGAPFTSIDSFDYLRISPDSTLRREYRLDTFGMVTQTSSTLTIADSDGDPVLSRLFGGDTLGGVSRNYSAYTYRMVGGKKYVRSKSDYVASYDDPSEYELNSETFYVVPDVPSATEQPIALTPCTLRSAPNQDLHLTTPIPARVALYDFAGRLHYDGRVSAGETALPATAGLRPGLYILYARGADWGCSAKVVR